jgi:hypothetical protein
VPPADPAALAAAIGSLVADPALAARLGEEGYRTVAERFSIDAQVKRIEAVYDEELARAGVLPRARPPQPVRVLARPAERGALEVPPV